MDVLAMRFQNVADPGAGLSGAVIYPMRAAEQAVLSRSAALQDADLSINLDTGIIMAISEDGLSSPSLVAVGPSRSLYASRQPYRLPWLDVAPLDVPDTSSCLSFSVTMTDIAADSLDYQVSWMEFDIDLVEGRAFADPWDRTGYHQSSSPYPR